jgi:anti-sigma factor ChrR (cupin superfamily)
MFNPGECPTDPEEFAESYIMGRLSSAEIVAFEEHCLLCADCRAAVEAAEAFVRAIKEAAQNPPL